MEAWLFSPHPGFVTGRWLSNDPIGISGGLNQYVFCANNPVHFVDPFGLVPPPAPVDAFNVGELTRVVYGETGGLYPQRGRGNRGSIYDPNVWDRDSYMLLQQARRAVAEISTRNGDVYKKDKCQDNIEHRAWIDSEAAALEASLGLESGQSVTSPAMTRFFLRQQGVGPQRPGDIDPNLRPSQSYGPFNNVGGGDAPSGPRLYIDVYAP